MVSKYAPDNSETACPACGAAIKWPASSRRRRVQCPKCREVVTLGEAIVPQIPSLPPPLPPSTRDAGSESEHSRIEVLEARVEALEERLRNQTAAHAIPEPASPHASKLQWIPASVQSDVVLPEHEEALVHNLSGIPVQEITLRAAAGDRDALKRAQWFKTVFQRAGWAVLGPDEVSTGSPGPGLWLAVSSLPVAKGAAATYLALRAAGFDATPVLDAGFASKEEKEGVVLSLTVASAKVP
jgi:hypothetical protein